MSRNLKELPFEFALDLILEYKFEKKQIKDIRGRLECSENHYCISFCTCEEKTDIITCDVNKFMYGKFRNVFIIKACNFDGEPTKIDTEESYLTHLRQSQKVSGSQTEWILEIDKFRIIKDSAIPVKKSIIRYYLSNYGDKITTDYTGIIRSNREFRYKEKSVVLGYNNDAKVPFLELHEDNENNLYELLCLLSFYYMRPIKYWRCERCAGKDVIYDFHTVYMTFIKQSNRHNEWDHLFMDIKDTKLDEIEKRQSIKLQHLLNYASDAFRDTSSPKYNIVLRAIHNYVDVLCDSEQGQLVIYVNIIVSLAEKLHNYCYPNSTSNIKKLFREANVSFSRIDDELQKKDFHKTITVPDECSGCLVMIRKNKISTFVDLRNEFVHGLPSKEMIDYIHDSLLLSRLKMAVFRILLYELGFSNLQYKVPNEQLNIQY